ncbi:papain family cysteine protease [Oesophagostomum dentatum]|uniref:Papain family cysteine protease n=1 Tax=Oesophagostomum dentatum TaxID=61180 RepID=A0A0B1TCL1_OESDE|nr:papain family cysteine protease [Oesophagostomum dentatum]
MPKPIILTFFLHRCHGGNPITAWMYVKQHGTCSGGPYNPSATNACKPYPFHPCGYHYEPPYLGDCPKDGYEKPACKEECQPGFSKKYDQNKIYVEKHYKVRKSVKDIQKEILVFGPVQAAITVYEDFYHYRKGIYWLSSNNLNFIL